MAEGGYGENNERMVEVRGMRRAQMLLQVIEDVRRRREEGRGSSSPHVPVGTVGIVPRDLMGKSPHTCVARG